MRHLALRTPRLAAAILAALLAATAILGLSAASGHAAASPQASVVWNARPALPQAVSWG
jgi:hypothetical protein